MSTDDAEAKQNPTEASRDQPEQDKKRQSEVGHELGQLDYSFGTGTPGADLQATELAAPPSAQGVQLKTAKVQEDESARLVSTESPQEFSSELAVAGAADSTNSDGRASSSMAANRATGIHSDLADSKDQMFGEGAFIPFIVGGSFLVMGLELASPDASSAWCVGAVFGFPLLVAGFSGYIRDQYWRKRASWVFASEKPVIQRVKFSKNISERGLFYEATVPAIKQYDAPEVVRINKSSQTIELLPEFADARVFRDPITGKIALVEIDSNIDSGWRLWCRDIMLLGAGRLKDYWWVPKALAAYFVAASVVMLIIFSQNNAGADQAKAWPTTEGKITQVNKIRRAAVYRYSYTVDGQQYDSDRIGMFTQQTHNKYALGEDVLVHYDPQKPDRSVLQFDGDWYSLCWSMAMLTFAFLSFITSLASDFKQKDKG